MMQRPEPFHHPSNLATGLLQHCIIQTCMCTSTPRKMEEEIQRTNGSRFLLSKLIDTTVELYATNKKIKPSCCFQTVERGAGIFPRVEFWRFSQNRPPTRVSRTPKTANRIFIHTAASRRRLRLEERTSTVG